MRLVDARTYLNWSDRTMVLEAPGRQALQKEYVTDAEPGTIYRFAHCSKPLKAAFLLMLMLVMGLASNIPMTNAQEDLVKYLPTGPEMRSMFPWGQPSWQDKDGDPYTYSAENMTPTQGSDELARAYMSFRVERYVDGTDFLIKEQKEAAPLARFVLADFIGAYVVLVQWPIDNSRMTTIRAMSAEQWRQRDKSWPDARVEFHDVTVGEKAYLQSAYYPLGGKSRPILPYGDPTKLMKLCFIKGGYDVEIYLHGSDENLVGTFGVTYRESYYDWYETAEPYPTENSVPTVEKILSIARIVEAGLPAAPAITVSSDVVGVVVDGVSAAKITVKLPTTEKKSVTLTDRATKQTKDTVNGEAVFEYVPDLKKLGISLVDVTKDGYEIELTASTSDGQQSASTKLKIYRRPVVLVHGLWSSASLWDTMKSRMEHDKFDVYVVDYRADPAKAIDQIAMNEVANMIDKAKEDYRNRGIGITKVDAVGHSMGGLAVQYYIAHGAERGQDVYTLIMVGTPHDGSPWPEFYENSREQSWARWIFDKLGATSGDALQQLKPGSQFLEELNNADLNLKVRYYNIIGTDNSIALKLRAGCESYERARAFLANQERNPAACRVLDPMIVPGDGVVSLQSQQGLHLRVPQVTNYYVNAGHWSLEMGIQASWGSYPAVQGEAVHPDTYKIARTVLLERDAPLDLQRIDLHERMIVAAGCPVVLSAYDSSGNVLPLNVEQPPEGEPVAYSWEENDILYLAMLDGSGDYVVVAEGKEAGTFSLTIVRNAPQGTVVASHDNVDVQANSRASVAVGDQSSYSMEMDRDGDGTVDETIPPTSLETVKPDGDGPKQDDGLLLMTVAGVLILILVVAIVIVVSRRRHLTGHRIAQPTVEQRQIETPSGFAFCENCGKQIPTGSTFCVHCGDKQGE